MGLRELALERHPLRRAPGRPFVARHLAADEFAALRRENVRELAALKLTATDLDRIVVSEIYPFITATNFGKNRMGKLGAGPASNYAEGDTAEFVAGLILQAIAEGQAQYFANDRLRKMAGA